MRECVLVISVNRVDVDHLALRLVDSRLMRQAGYQYDELSEANPGYLDKAGSPC